MGGWLVGFYILRMLNCTYYIKLLLGGQDMEITQDTHQLRTLLDTFKAATNALCDAIHDGSGFAFYADADGFKCLGNEARTKICGHLHDYRWSGRDDLDSIGAPQIPSRFMVCALPPDSIEVGVSLNRSKAAFENFHVALRERFDSQLESTQYFRKVLLANYGEPLLNPEAVDGKLTLANGYPTKIRYYYHHSQASQRKYIPEARAALEALWHKSNDDDRERISQELARLARLPDDYPVAFRNRKPVTTLKATISGMIISGRRISDAAYARNPILIPDIERHPPINVVLPREITGEQRKGTQGRRPTVSDEKLSAFLPNWYKYIDPNNVPPIPQKGKKGNQISSVPVTGSRTQISGIWFGLNRVGTPVFFVKTVEGKQSSVSIGRHGLQKAWKLAVDKHFVTEQEQHQAYDLCPGQNDLDAFMSFKQ